jgi:CheY-like chemotaxis protein
MLTECLEELGYPLLCAENGMLALKMIESNPSIIAALSDVKMPGMTGLELLKKVREQERVVPFLFLSGHSSKVIIMEARKLDAFSVIDKPYDERVLRQRVRLLLTLGEAIRKLDADVVRLCEEKKIPADQAEEFKKSQIKKMASEIVQKMRTQLLYGGIK